MIKGSDLILEVSKYLVDQEHGYEFTMVSERELLGYFRMAVLLFASHNKEQFQARKEFKLVPGSLQEIPVGCEEVNDVYGMKGEDGLVDTRVRKTDLTMLQSMKRPVCRVDAEGNGYTLDSYQYDPSNPKLIHVDPPVPEGADATMVISCFHPPVVTSAEEGMVISELARPVIFEFMLYYAYGVDAESVPARDRSNTHFQNGMGLMGLSQQKSANRYAYTRVPEARAR